MSRGFKSSLTRGTLFGIAALFWAGTFFVSTSAQAEEHWSDRIVSYRIDVRYDPEQKKLTGNEAVVWTNPGTENVQEIYFHLYPNAFAKGSSFIKESGGQLRGDKINRKALGAMKITALTLPGGQDGLKQLTYVQPDDDNKEDRTLAKIPLLAPVKPGESITVQLAFEVQLPEVFARMGYWEDFVMAGQWYPKLAVYEPSGIRGRTTEGWNAHQYHAHSEFYADFGTFNVSITLPEAHKVAATGQLVEVRTLSSGERVWRFTAGDVHDFAWSASPHFITEQRSIPRPPGLAEMAEWQNLPGMSPTITLSLYLDPAHESAKERYFNVAIQSLALYSQWYGPYPYDTLSIVVPPPGASGAGGMEYPTLITAWDGGAPMQGLLLENVVIHELAHQYWYGMVASNEFEEAWLDESFATYTEEKVMEQLFPGNPYTSTQIPIFRPQPLTWNAWQYNESTYAPNVYTRGSRVLMGIEAVVGQQKMEEVLRTYFLTYRFKHPSTEDFLNTVEQVSGKDFQDYFSRFVYGREMIDHRIVSIEYDEERQESQISLAVDNSLGLPARVWIVVGDRVEQREWKTLENRTVITIPEKVDQVQVQPLEAAPLEAWHYNNQRRYISAEEERAWIVRLVTGMEWILKSFIW